MAVIPTYKTILSGHAILYVFHVHPHYLHYLFKVSKYMLIISGPYIIGELRLPILPALDGGLYNPLSLCRAVRQFLTNQISNETAQCRCENHVCCSIPTFTVCIWKCVCSGGTCFRPYKHAHNRLLQQPTHPHLKSRPNQGSHSFSVQIQHRILLKPKSFFNHHVDHAN